WCQLSRRPESHVILFVRSGALIQSVFLDLVEQRAMREIEKAGGARAVAAGLLEGALYERAFERLGASLDGEIEIIVVGRGDGGLQRLHRARQLLDVAAGSVGE